MADRFVTAFHPEGFKQYGYRLIETFNASADAHNIRVYASDIHDNRYEGNWGRTVWHEQFDIQELAAFLDRHKDNPHVQGRRPDERWKDKDRKAGYNYRFDMGKFSRMIYVMWAEAHRDPIGRMVWLDGDCVIRKQLPNDFIDRALPDGYSYAYLGRPGKYTETGFLVMDLSACLPILDAWVAYCTDDTFRHEKEQHSAYLWDRAREKFPEINGYNLTPNGRGHVIHQTWVGGYIDHCKGNRKFKGKSPEAK